MSLGPELVTDRVRAEERAEERAHRQAEQPRVVSGQKTATLAPKKRKTIPSELEERQKKASARMQELGVPPLEVELIRCPVCHQLRTSSDKTPGSQIHCVLGWSNKIWCPYADDKLILEPSKKNRRKEHTGK